MPEIFLETILLSGAAELEIPSAPVVVSIYGEKSLLSVPQTVLLSPVSSTGWRKNSVLVLSCVVDSYYYVARRMPWRLTRRPSVELLREAMFGGLISLR